MCVHVSVRGYMSVDMGEPGASEPLGWRWELNFGFPQELYAAVPVAEPSLQPCSFFFNYCFIFYLFIGLERWLRG